MTPENAIPARKGINKTIVTVSGIIALVILGWRDPSLAPEIVTGLLGVVGFHHLSGAS